MSVHDDQELKQSSTGADMPRYSTLNKVGFVLAIVNGLVNVTSVANPTPEGQNGPPMVILVVDAVLGLGIIVAVLIGWLRGRRAAIRAATAMLILAAITALPAFVVPDIPAGLVAGVGVYVLLTIVTIVLMLKPARTAGV
jgi:hypothetical protein